MSLTLVRTRFSAIAAKNETTLGVDAIAGSSVISSSAARRPALAGLPFAICWRASGARGCLRRYASMKVSRNSADLRSTVDACRTASHRTKASSSSMSLSSDRATGWAEGAGRMPT